MPKKLTILLIIIIMICVSFGTVFASADFSDMRNEHWAHNFVTSLVQEGTIGGYLDGTFRPDGQVTRAEFVKMIGKGSVLREKQFDDVPKDHWSYDYIMSSGLDEKDNNLFAPDTAITRGETAQLLWQRSGSMSGIEAPFIITKQSENKDAIAFVYMYGIMNGNDGINLRLNDTLSRAEAAALIIRTRQINTTTPQINFSDKVSEDILKAVFDGFMLFDGMAYNSERKFTNGEIARAALRLASDEFNLTYKNYPAYTYDFEDEYAKDLSIIANQCIGTEKLSKQFANEYANTENTLVSLVFGSIKRANFPIATGAVNNYYKDVPSTSTNGSNSCLTFAYKNGIVLYENNNLKPNKQITAKDFAVILLQLDELIGLQTVISTAQTDGKYSLSNHKISKQVSAYPSNAELYMCVIEGIPNYVYEAPFRMLDASISPDPKTTYQFAKEFKELFVKQLDKIVDTAKDTYGIKLEFSFFPSLVYDNGKGFTMRVLCKVTNAGNELEYTKLFGENTIRAVNGNLTDGQEFFIEITTKYDVFN